MGNNLLDALKTAGLADAKKAKKAENDKKQQLHRELKRAENKAEAPVQELQCTKSQAIQNVEIQVRDRLAQAYKNAALANVSGRKKFYFTTLERQIDCLMISDVANALIERGKYAIIANEMLDDYIVVSRATALTVEAIDKKRIIVFKRQES